MYKHPCAWMNFFGKTLWLIACVSRANIPLLTAIVGPIGANFTGRAE
jgi:hypothetical protein